MTEDANEMLEEQQRELERIRGKRHHTGNHDRLRQVLNVAFLIVAAVGLVLYFYLPADRHVVGLSILGVGLFLKMIEFFIRFML